MKKEKQTISTLFMLLLVFFAALPLLSLNMFMPSLGIMAKDFEVGYDAIALTISSYLLFTALTQIVVGPLADRYGRRPTVLVGLIGFIAGSLGCAFAESYEMFFFGARFKAV